MAMGHFDEQVLEGANMLQDMFDGDSIPALERRIAWALDCARIDDVMYWLTVQEAFTASPSSRVYFGPSA